MASKWIWPFELQEKLGEGGMGVVFRARYVGNNRIVAVKLLPDDVAQNATLVARFDRELEILTQLRHPHIVHCFGGTTESKQRFYAMELVEGGTLADVLRKKGPISWDHVLEFGMQMCEALQYAHERGVIHRDLKPANFLVTKAGKVKLSDFGLATIVAGQRLTVAGRTAGTFLYMAPEQIRGKPPLTNRTDLYALGCVFYELLTGQPPFMADTPAEILHKHLKEPPPRLAQSVLDCPKELDQLVTDLLQKDPALRPASAVVVQQRLEMMLRPSVTHVDPFARTPSAGVVPVVSSTPEEADSVDDLPAPAASPAIVRTLSLAIGISGLLAAWGWWWWLGAAQSASIYREAWVQTATSPGPAQIPALQQLSRFPTASSALTEKLMRLVESETNPDVRVAALETLSKHASESRPVLPRMLSLERTEPDAMVRQQLSSARQVIQSADEHSGGWSGWLWPVVLLAGFGGAGWWGWQKLQSRFG